MWVLDADLTAAFDKIDHDRLLAAIGDFPGRTQIRGWLKAGVFEAGKGFAPTDAGTPQGGVISPLLLNIALHGLEEAAGVRHERSDPQRTRRGSPSLIRYADDMVALCYSKQQAEDVKTRLAAWLAPRGLTFNEDKTRIVHLDDGFDFLGFTARRRNGKLLMKPSKAAVKRVRQRLSAEFRAPARLEPGDSPREDQPDRAGLGELLPRGSIVHRVRRAGRAPVAAHLQMGLPQPFPQAEALDRQQVLRPV